MGIGATVHEDHRKPDGTGWVTMADPEGNLSASIAAPPSASDGGRVHQVVAAMTADGTNSMQFTSAGCRSHSASRA